MKGFITAKEATEKWGVSTRSVQALCAEGKIGGATKMARYGLFQIVPNTQRIVE